MARIGLISDTHGLLRPQALDALRGCERILHAGDIGSASLLDALAALAPVTAVRGNNDRDAWADALPQVAQCDCDGLRLLVVHDISQLRDAPQADVIVSGHSHRPHVERRAGVLYVNPGSAGPRRFSLPVTIAYLEVGAGRAEARLVPLL